jgi:hypothetical protein
MDHETLEQRPPGDWQYIPATAEEALRLILEAAYRRVLTGYFNLSPAAMRALKEIARTDRRLACGPPCADADFNGSDEK